MISALRIVGPCDVYDDEGDCVATGFGIVETDGIEAWDVEFPFENREDAAKRLASIARERATAVCQSSSLEQSSHSISVLTLEGTRFVAEL